MTTRRLLVRTLVAIVGLVAVGGCRPYTPPSPVPEPEPGPIATAKSATSEDPPASSPVPACITWRKLVRYRPYGYDHLVIIRSTCSSSATCVVTTDVNPKPIRVLVAPNVEVEVVTFVGSPASTFEADVRCELQFLRLNGSRSPRAAAPARRAIRRAPRARGAPETERSPEA